MHVVHIWLVNFAWQDQHDIDVCVGAICKDNDVLSSVIVQEI